MNEYKHIEMLIKVNEIKIKVWSNYTMNNKLGFKIRLLQEENKMLNDLLRNYVE